MKMFKYIQDRDNSKINPTLYFNNFQFIEETNWFLLNPFLIQIPQIHLKQVSVISPFHPKMHHCMF